MEKHLYAYGNMIFYKYIAEKINVLFNDALNTFYLRLYGARHSKGPFS